VSCPFLPLFTGTRAGDNADIAINVAADAADDWCIQMNSVLKDDFEKKMTVVGLLKQYAQNRDVDTFASGLSVILADAKHQSLLHHIRWSITQHINQAYSAVIAQFRLSGNALV